METCLSLDMFHIIAYEHMNLALVIIGICYLFISGIYEEIQLIKFKSQIHVGTKLVNVYKMLDNEFDPGHKFEITILEVGEKQVKVAYSDGSETVWDIQQLYNENWKFQNEL